MASRWLDKTREWMEDSDIDENNATKSALIRLDRNYLNPAENNEQMIEDCLDFFEKEHGVKYGDRNDFEKILKKEIL